jgi:hypothetical protein
VLAGAAVVVDLPPHQLRFGFVVVVVAGVVLLVFFMVFVVVAGGVVAGFAVVFLVFLGIAQVHDGEAVPSLHI